MNKIKKIFATALALLLVIPTTNVKAEKGVVDSTIICSITEDALATVVNNSKVTNLIKDKYTAVSTNIKITKVSASVGEDKKFLLTLQKSDGSKEIYEYTFNSSNNSLNMEYATRVGGTVYDPTMILYYVAEATTNESAQNIVEAMKTKYDRVYDSTSGYTLESTTIGYKFSVKLTDEFVTNELKLDSNNCNITIIGDPVPADPVIDPTNPIDPVGPAIIPEGYNKLDYDELVNTISNSKVFPKIKAKWEASGKYSLMSYRAELGDHGETILYGTGNYENNGYATRYEYKYIATLNDGSITYEVENGNFGPGPEVILYFLAEATADATPDEIMAAFDKYYDGKYDDKSGYAIEKSGNKITLAFNFTDEFVVNKLKLKSKLGTKSEPEPTDPTPVDPEPTDPTPTDEPKENPDTGAFLNISLIALTTAAAAGTVVFTIKKRKFFNI